MADETEPESKPITVSELIARSGGDDAFPRSESVSVRRPDTGSTRATASGMPSYTPPTKRALPDAPRVVGASGMPAFTAPEPAPADDTGVIPVTGDTGVIPVIGDDMVDTGSLRKVEADDLFDYDLPPAVIRSGAAETTDALTVTDAATAATPVEDTTTIPLVDDDFEPVADETDAATEAADSEAVEETAEAVPEVGADILDTSEDDKAAAKTAAKSAKAEEKAARKAAKAEAKAAQAAARDDEEPSAALGWAAFAGEIVLGLGVGAGLFWGFTELWKRYVYLALVLAIVVIFAVVTFAHLLRKRDLATTLLALAVGMLVTIGPLAFLAAQP